MSNSPQDKQVSAQAILDTNIEDEIERIELGEISADALRTENTRLRTELESSNAELQKLQGQLTTDQVRAKLMEPYANKVFLYLIVYSVSVLALILLSSIRIWRGPEESRTLVPILDIGQTVLSIVAGSTAVAAIGLVGFVVSGLFDSGKVSKKD